MNLTQKSKTEFKFTYSNREFILKASSNEKMLEWFNGLSYLSNYLQGQNNMIDNNKIDNLDNFD